jgi:arsenate reductase
MITLYHNPRCSKSRQTLQLLNDNNIEPEIVLYLESTPDSATIYSILNKLNISARQLMRNGEDAYKENNLGNHQLTEDELIDAMTKFPKIIQRPIVINGDKAAIGRPPESVLDIL